MLLGKRCPHCYSDMVSLVGDRIVKLDIISHYSIECKLSDLIEKEPAQVLDGVFKRIVSDLSSATVDADVIREISVGTIPDVPLACQECGKQSRIAVSISWVDLFYFYLDKYLNAHTESILRRASGLSINQLREFGDIDTLVWSIAEESTKHSQYVHLALNKLVYVKSRLDTLGGKGGGAEELALYLQNIALGVASAIVFEIIKYGSIRAFRLIRNLRAKRYAKRLIREGMHDFDLENISIKDLGKYISADESLSRLKKKKIIEKIAQRHAENVRSTLRSYVENRNERS